MEPTTLEYAAAKSHGRHVAWRVAFYLLLLLEVVIILGIVGSIGLSSSNEAMIARVSPTWLRLCMKWHGDTPFAQVALGAINGLGLVACRQIGRGRDRAKTIFACFLILGALYAVFDLSVGAILVNQGTIFVNMKGGMGQGVTYLFSWDFCMNAVYMVLSMAAVATAYALTPALTRDMPRNLTLYSV